MRAPWAHDHIVIRKRSGHARLALDLYYWNTCDPQTVDVYNWTKGCLDMPVMSGQCLIITHYLGLVELYDG